MEKIKKIGVLSFGKIMGAMYAFMGLIAGGIVAIVIIFGQGAGSFNFGFGVGSIILFPILYGILGFLSGLLFGWFYNVSAKWLGGVEIEI